MLIGVWTAVAGLAATTSTGDTAWWNSTGDTGIVSTPSLPDTGQTGDTGLTGPGDSGGSAGPVTHPTDGNPNTDTGGEPPKGCACDLPPATPAGLAMAVVLAAAAIARRRALPG